MTVWRSMILLVHSSSCFMCLPIVVHSSFLTLNVDSHSYIPRTFDTAFEIELQRLHSFHKVGRLICHNHIKCCLLKTELIEARMNEKLSKKDEIQQ